MPPTPLNPAAETLTLLDPPGHEDVVSTIARWHDDTHPGAWPFCDQQPCQAVRRATNSTERTDPGLACQGCGHPTPKTCRNCGDLL